MSTSALGELMDTIDRVGLERPEDFYRDAFALLGLAISRLGSAQRESVLQEIEDGSLRRAVAKYESCRPGAADGGGWLQ